MQVDREK